MRVKKRPTTPAAMLAEVYKEQGDNKKFDLYVFCKLYKYQVEELSWNKLKTFFAFLKRKKVKIDFFNFTLPEKEHLKNGAKTENLTQYAKNPGLATVVQFLMEDRQITQLEERVLFWIYQNVPHALTKKQAKDKIINGNKKILFYFLKRQHFKLDHDEGEMLTEGYMEMVRMFEKFKPETNYKFLSYVQYSIIQVMRKTITLEQNIIQLPLNVLNQIYKLNRWLENNGGDADIEKYKKENKISDKTMLIIEKYRKNFGGVGSIDKIITDDSKRTTIADVLVDENKPDDINKTQEIIGIFNEILEPMEIEVMVNINGIGCEKITKKEFVKTHPEITTFKLNEIYNSAIKKLKNNRHRFEHLIE